MIAISRSQWWLVLSLSTVVHAWVLVSWDFRQDLGRSPELTEIIITLSEISQEAVDSAVAEVPLHTENIEAIEPDSVEAIDVEVPEVVEAVDQIELVAVDEVAAIEEPSVDSVDAVAIEAVEIVEVVAEEPEVEEAVVEEEIAQPVVVEAAAPQETILTPPVQTVTQVVQSESPKTTTKEPERTKVPNTQVALKGYLKRVQTVLQRNKRYPDSARRVGQEGLVVVQFVLGRFGQVLAYEIENSSGYSILDREAISLIRRVNFPGIPGVLKESSIEFVVPLRFALN